MEDGHDNRDLDLRTTPHSRLRGVWVFVSILVILAVLIGYAWIKVSDAVLVLPKTTNKAVTIPGRTSSLWKPTDQRDQAQL